MLDAINRFRWQNGVGSVRHTDKIVDSYCLMHCLEMCRRNAICHAPQEYLEDWSEAVASMQYCDDWKDRIIFDIMGSSEGHRDLLLNSDTIAYASYIHDGVVYATVRGQNRG